MTDMYAVTCYYGILGAIALVAIVAYDIGKVNCEHRCKKKKDNSDER